MIPGLELAVCQDLAVPLDVMEHVVRVESSFNPYAIGVVGARLARQPRSLEEAVATAASLEREGYNFSLGLAQVNRYNLVPQGLDSYEKAFSPCANLAAGARILADCHVRAGGDWGRAFSCYYSGNFERGFRDGYVRKVQMSMQSSARVLAPVIPPIAVIGHADTRGAEAASRASLRERRAMRGAGPGAIAGIPSSDETQGPVPASASGESDPDAPFVPQVTGPPPDAAGPRQALQAQATSHPPADSAFVF